MLAALCPEAIAGQGSGQDETSSDLSLTRTQLYRLMFLLLLFVASALTQVLYQDKQHLAAFTHGVRRFLYGGGSMMNQMLLPEVEAVLSRDNVSDLLHALQRRCFDNELVAGSKNFEHYLCDLTRIDFDEVHGAKGAEVIFCDDSFLTEVVEVGDQARYGVNPTLLDTFYARRDVHPSKRYRTVFNQLHDHPLLKPLVHINDDGEWGPMALLNLKLDRLWTELVGEDDLFAKNPALMTLGSHSQRFPSMTRISDRNHHWDYLLACNPGEVKVTVSVARQLRDGAKIEFFKMDLKFSRIGGAFYGVQLQFRGVWHPHTRSLWMVVWPLCVVGLFGLMLAYPIGAVVIYFPYNLYRFLKKDLEFDVAVGHLLDPVGARLSTLSWTMILLENVAGVLILSGFLASIQLVASSTSPLAFATGFETRVSVLSKIWRVDWLSPTDRLVETIYGLFADNRLHVYALAVQALRLSEALCLLEEAAFLLMTFAFCLWPMIQFLTVFGGVIFAFAVVLHVTFGAYFHQFANVSRAFTVLCYDAFGLVSSDFYSQKFIEEQNCAGLMLLRLAFRVLVAVLILNMGTTIVMDAYRISIQNVNKPEKMERLQRNRWETFRRLCGYGPSLPKFHRTRFILDESERPDKGKLYDEIAELKLMMARLRRSSSTPVLFGD
ncbi:MAG: hypothetical protein KVP17_000778 [Porospora cf. gigantea B]|uniref:uncharacterized protein n=2 Tax=Porospora cf. gigantea B TaxID=2853592 RepID=UPI003571A648|nr:MAG: hypothetical protein KVP17_000778 [Porospora cf. gigantea B]